MKDLACNKCMHKTVCSYKDDYEKVNNAIDSLTIVSDDGEGVSMTPIGNYDWITVLAPACKYYHYKTTTPR